MCVSELEMVDVLAFFSGVLTDLKRAGKQYQMPADSVTRPRGWIWRRHCSGAEHSLLRQTKRTNCHKFQRQAADLPDSESEDENSASVSANTSFHRQAIPPLINELSSRWQHTMNAMTSESSHDDELLVVEVIVLLLTVIKHIVYEDIKSAEEISTSTHLVPNIATILRDIICQLTSSTDCQTEKAFNDVDLIIIGRCLVRLFFLMLLQIGEQNNGLTWLRNCKSIEESMDCVSESLHMLSVDVKRRLLLMDYVLSCWLYAEGLLLRHHANTIVIGTVCRTTELITRHRGLDLTRCVLLSLSGEDSDDLLRLLDLIKHVVAVCRLLKLMRSRYVHYCTCSRRTHRHCNITSQRSIYRHHHDALGIAVHSVPSDKLHMLAANASSDWLSSYCTLTNSCIVSCLAIFLLGLFHHLVDTQVQKYLLDTFEKGTVTCCCLPVHLLVSTFVTNQTSVSSQLCRRSVSVLVKVLLNDCGGSAVLDHCSVCDDVSKSTSIRSVTSTFSNALSGSQTPDLSSVCRWKCVSQFAKILCSGDSMFTIHIISQAVRLASNGSESLRQQLYCGFFMPLLVTVVHQLTAHGDNDSSMLTTVLSVDVVASAVKLCLSALSMIVANTEMLRQFVTAGGIEMLCKLADVNSTRPSALSLLEVLVNVENSNTEREQTQQTLAAVNDHSDDDAADVGALDAFSQLLFSDCSDRPWNEYIRESLQSSKCRLAQMLDLWHVACRLFPQNGLFRQRFLMLNGPQLAHLLLVAASEAFLALDCGPSASNIRVAVFYGQDEQSHVEERSLLLLVRSTLSICLRCSNFDVGIPHQVKRSPDCNVVFSERELKFTFAICHPPSVCLSSVMFVHPTQAIEIFRNVSMPCGTLAIRDFCIKILRRSSQGNPFNGV